MTNEIPDIPPTCGRFTDASTGGGVRMLAVYRFRIPCGRQREDWRGSTGSTARRKLVSDR